MSEDNGKFPFLDKITKDVREHMQSAGEPNGAVDATCPQCKEIWAVDPTCHPSLQKPPWGVLVSPRGTGMACPSCTKRIRASHIVAGCNCAVCGAESFGVINPMFVDVPVEERVGDAIGSPEEIWKLMQEEHEWTERGDQQICGVCSLNESEGEE